jgi:hypothetical protein
MVDDDAESNAAMSDATDNNTTECDATKSNAAESNATQGDATWGEAPHSEASEEDDLTWNSCTQTLMMPLGNASYSTFYEPNWSLLDILTLSDSDFRCITQFCELAIKNEPPRQTVFWADNNLSNLTRVTTQGITIAETKMRKGKQGRHPSIDPL